MGYLPFVESFVLEVFEEDFNTIISLPMLVDPQITFAMLSFCYTQHPNYLQHIVFPSLGILQHYTKFDACTIVMFKKLLRSRSFGTIVGHLACHQVILLFFSRG
jgi:hypothetical protein